MAAYTKKRRVFVKVVTGIIAAFVLLVSAVIIYILYFLPKVSVPVLKVDLTPERIERGKYLANHVAVCMDCHSTRDWGKYSGPMLAGTEGKGGEPFTKDFGFPGNYYAPNITPSKLKTWSDGELFRAITAGVSKDGRALFPVMNYLAYGSLDKEDIYSIIAYLRTIPPVDNNVPESKSDFPMNIIINTIPRTGEFSKKPDTTDILKYGKYLVTMAGCIDCHTKDNKGELVKGMEYAGGREFVMPFGKIVSANITPDVETGIGSWNEDIFLYKFKAFSNENISIAVPVKNGEFNSIMPWSMYAGMKETDLKAIYAYLKSVKPISNRVASGQIVAK